jgi:hypothetical protein
MVDTALTTTSAATGGTDMHHPETMLRLARDHQHELIDEARRARLGRELTATGRATPGHGAAISPLDALTRASTRVVRAPLTMLDTVVKRVVTFARFRGHASRTV